MKKTFFLLIAIAFINQLNAQNTFNIGSFTVKKINFSLGYETDMVDGLDYSYFTNQMPIAQQGLFSSADFNPSTLYGGICENPSINAGVTLIHESLPNIEWRNALSFKPNRVDAVSYYSNDFFGGEYVSFTSDHTEFAVESALLYKLPILKFFNLYGGIGTNLGYVAHNRTCVFSSIDFNVDNLNYSNASERNDQVMSEDYEYYSECYETGSQINQRVFLQGGAGLTFFNKLEVGLDLKYGYGYRADFKNDAIGTNIIATNLSLRYILNDIE